MPEHFETVDVGAVAAFPTTPQVDLSELFVPDEYLIANKHGSEIVAVSFDGVEIHGKLDPNDATGISRWRTKAQRVWLRNTTAPGGNVNVEVSVSTDV